MRRCLCPVEFVAPRSRVDIVLQRDLYTGILLAGRDFSSSYIYI